MRIEAQNEKNEPYIGSSSMVSNGLNVLHKAEIITKKSSQRINLRP